MKLKHPGALKIQPVIPAKTLTPGVAPLVDIVFLLICFYLFVMQSIQTLDDPQVQLPTVSHVEHAILEPAEIVINLRHDGSLLVNHKLVTSGQLRAMLHREKQAASSKGADLRVVVRADRRQTFGKLDEVMTLCREAELGMIVLRAKED